MLGRVRGPAAAEPLDHLHLDHGIGIVHLEAHGIVVQLDDSAYSRIGAPGMELVVPVVVLVHKQNVSSAVKGAPSDQRTFAQLQRYALGVSGELVALRRVGNDLAVGGHLQDPRGAARP